MAVAILTALRLLGACSRRGSEETPPTTATATAIATRTSPATAVGVTAPVTPPKPPYREDAGAAACLLVRGPIQLPLRGAVALAIEGDTLEAVLNDNGRPRVLSLAAGAVPFASSPGPELGEGTIPAGSSVPCAVAGEQTFCPDRTGAVHRARLDASGERVVASSRSGSRVSAAILGGTRTAFAYLASRETSEGWVSEAWIGVDDAAPIRLSEDGSGATAVTLQMRGGSLLALMVDSRTALTAMHARPLMDDSAVRLGEDAVVFVGGPGDRRTTAALAVAPGGLAWGLLPIGKDVGDFGLAIVRLDAPPRVDEPVVWSMYPNGLDPAPVAAAAALEHHARSNVRADAGTDVRAWVARVRPRAAEPGSTRELELGVLQEDSLFVARDIVTSSAVIGDVALAGDAHGTLWLAWVDGSGSWLERLACR